LRYSHAAIVLGGRNWFESNDGGVGFLYKRLSKDEVHERHYWRLINLSEYRVFEVFRHPGLDGVPDVDLSRLLMKIAGEWAGREYPPLRRLGRATPWLESRPKIKGAIADLIELADVHTLWDRVRFRAPGVVAPGPFCSDLVVRIFNALSEIRKDPQLVLFKKPRGSRRASPNDLADPNLSVLQRVPDIIVYEDLSIPDTRRPSDTEDRENQLEASSRALQAVLIQKVRARVQAERAARAIQSQLTRMTKFLQSLSGKRRS
jgi:hypothetical protein